ncbi:CLUMA_CG015911, isoform A [Clunio marinus]|uniref:CLUMA_CG015911, isoform A n=1 Tax=Clunio marinus TaxID=568069 RepID=A0A1J1IR21_9DIPT|nr:CLUMA_CG015911, isoform A [Clunio marinus]
MNIKGVFVAFCLIAFKSGNGKEICPRMCICDVFEGYKRADCSEQHLASPYTNVAKSVEILNLSGNEITTIDNECLVNYKALVKLSFAKNSIHTIELFAFESLEKLNYLDLSDNRLEVIDNRILERNEKLTFLDLSKNKFMSVENQPLIISSSLEFLSLQNSHLSHVFDSFFEEMSNLVDLDISNNLLITLVPSAFEPLESLQFINLEYNRFSCDFRIESTLQMFKQRKVHVKIDKCVKNSKKPMFEKMILHPDVKTEMPREDIEIDLVWGSSKDYRKLEMENENINKTKTFKDFYVKIKNKNDDALEEFYCDDDELFQSTCECHQYFIKYYEFVEEWKKKCTKANQKQIERQVVRDQLLINSELDTRVLQTIAEPQRNSPVPAIRNETTNLIESNEQRNVITPTRSPVPAPRNIQYNMTHSEDNRIRTEVPVRSRSSISSERANTELSPTAQLIHRLFRNRDQSFLPARSELIPINRNDQRSFPHRFQQGHDLRITEDAIYAEIPTAPNPLPIESEGDGSSEYFSIDNSSLILNPDEIRVESGTPPPAYRSIFEDYK